jgi:drug/metabolite transporter (DMT)-like permease
VAVFLGAWLADEAINARILVAGLVIIGSVILINQTKSTKARVKQEEAEPSMAD